MADTLCQFITWAVRDVIFASGDVQTTTIAMAITGSLCCSLVVAVVHMVALFLPQQPKARTDRKLQRSLSSPVCSKKSDSSLWFSNGKVYVPCVKCGKYYADEGCRFVTCKMCCFAVLSCHIHQKTTSSSKPCQFRQTDMDLSGLGMQEFPERMGFMGSQLTCLNLSQNALTELPGEIGCLRGLQHLFLTNNKLSTLPSTLESLSNLVSFDISNNQFDDLPACVTGLHRLQELGASSNQLTVLPHSISSLTNLIVLDTSYNQIKSLPEQLFTLFHLQVLVLRSNPLMQLPSSISGLIHLKVLDLQSCGLTTLPADIGRCINLTCLKLDDNALEEVPPQVGRLRSLQHLMLDNNKLKILPGMLAFLPDTINISVMGNPLITDTEFHQYIHTPGSGENLFPSLKELTAREIIKRNIPNTQTLPCILQDMLQMASCCSYCGGPLVDFYSSNIIPWHFLFSNVRCVPLLQKICSPHQPLRSCL